MPSYIRSELRDRGLTAAYRSRPLYQQNDYVGWITRAKRDETRRKRLEQMLVELACGDRYMNMRYRGPARKTRARAISKPSKGGAGRKS
jgi:hypothetical protein